MHPWRNNNLTTDYLRKACELLKARAPRLLDAEGKLPQASAELLQVASVVAQAADHIDRLELSQQPFIVSIVGLDNPNPEQPQLLIGLCSVGRTWVYRWPDDEIEAPAGWVPMVVNDAD